MFSTSKCAARKGVDEIDFSRPVVVVELGAGVGNVAEEIAKRMSPTSRLLLIEMNADFVAHLREKFVHDERVEIVEGAAQDVVRIANEVHIENADVVLANLPFSFFDEHTRLDSIHAVNTILKPGGSFIVFIFTRRIRFYLATVFSSITEKRIWWNIPPLRVFVARK